MDELLTVDEVAAYLRVSRSTVWRWCQAKKVPAFKIGREWRISGPVLSWIVASQQKAANVSQSEIGPPEPPSGGEGGEDKPEYPGTGTTGGTSGN